MVNPNFLVGKRYISSNSIRLAVSGLQLAVAVSSLRLAVFQFRISDFDFFCFLFLIILLVQRLSKIKDTDTSIPHSTFCRIKRYYFPFNFLISRFIRSYLACQTSRTILAFLYSIIKTQPINWMKE